MISGGDGNDLLDGGAQNDTIDGGAGDDTILGGNEDDLLTGGAGADVFAFRLLGEKSDDVITDFEDGVDFLDVEQEIRSIETVGSDTLITQQAGGTILLLNITADQITDADFLVSDTFL